MSNGSKIEVGLTSSIDISVGTGNNPEVHPQDVVDGLVFGDGMLHKASNDLALLCIGDNDQSYFESEVSSYIGVSREALNAKSWEVKTTLTSEEIPRTFDRRVPDRFLQFSKMRGFLRGLYSANGSVVATRVSLKATSFSVIESVQTMLSSLGIASYYTTNRAKPVTFNNGTYTCKESYDLQIGTLQGRRVFSDLIGFIQPYKNDKLAKLVGGEISRPKMNFDVVSTTPISEELVYDITVEADEHTYWSGGLLVSNCGEIPLHNREACNLAEIFPALIPEHRVFDVLRLITRYSLRQRLEPLKDLVAEASRVNNMRIGVGLGGVCDFVVDGATLGVWHAYVRGVATLYAQKLGVVSPIATTTVKPSGTISLLNGSSPGIHAPFAPFYIRRTRISKQEPMAQALIDAGVPYESCVYDSTGNTLVFSFPIEARNKSTETVQTESVRTQVERQVLLQTEWADNAVSTTISFREDEKDELAALLKKHAKDMKSISCLPKAHGYEQPPYEQITELQFKEMSAKIDHDHPLTSGGDLDTMECESGICPIK